MQGQNPNFPTFPQRHDSSEIAQWQWQSNLEPYKETDPAKWTWQNYSDDENLVIEEAFKNNKEVADLENYEIDLKNMLQISKKVKNSIRRVRRQEQNRFMIEIPEPKTIYRDQTTMNEAFGTVQHFLEFLMKRTPEAFTLYQKLTKFSLDCDHNDFRGLINEVIISIERGAEARAKIIKNRTGSRVRDFIKEGREIIKMIENNSATLRDFLKAILKAYTMETFVCYWLNELLRGEVWEKINVLTPYLVCLVYTFKLPDYVLKHQSSINKRLGFVVKHRLYLFRGASFTEQQLANYNPSKVNYFSWNAVTSTSRDRNVALKYIDVSLCSRSNIGVIFSIEIDFDSMEDSHGMIDVSRDSRYPSEQEVILAPGTVFKLLEISLIENEIYEIRLKVTKNFKKAHENIPLLGIRHDQSISKDKAIIDGLPSQESFSMLKLLRKNESIQKIEIRNSGIEELTLEEIESVRATTNVRKEDIKLVGNRICVRRLSVLVYYFSQQNLSEILMLNKIRFRSEVVKSHFMSNELQIENLVLKDETIKMLSQDDNQLDRFLQELKNENEMKKLTLSIQKTQISNSQLRDLFECIKCWKYLEELSLKLNEHQTNSIQNFNSLCQAISSSTFLKELSLNFPPSNQGLILLQDSLKSLKCLQNLDLDFENSHQMSDEGLGYLKSGLSSSRSLQHLSLNFGFSQNFSDKGLGHLKELLRSLAPLKHLSLGFEGGSFSDKGFDYLINSITSLKSLQYLHLSFKGFHQISEEGLNSLKSICAYLENLQHFSCNIFACNQISDENLHSFMSEFPLSLSLEHLLIEFEFSHEITCFIKSAIVSLTPSHHLSFDLKFLDSLSDNGLDQFSSRLIFYAHLQKLSLNFSQCLQISDEGLKYLAKGLTSLKSLLSLSLSFWKCQKISDNGLWHISSSLESFESLQRLSLNFCGCDEISDGGLDRLTHGLFFLKSLQDFSLDVDYCKKVSDQALQSLQNALNSFTTLQYLCLNLFRCDQISGKGLDHLINGITFHTSLKLLFLNFDYCLKISDEGLDSLCTGLKLLTSLQYLYLNFWFCNKISDKGVKSLSETLMSLKHLQDFSLDIEHCKQISNKGLDHLSKALTFLRSLQHLFLNFRDCKHLSNKGLNYLTSALSSFLSLQYLSLNFQNCQKISDQAFESLNGELNSLTSLQHLSLNFRHCRRISDNGLYCIKNVLQSFASLQYLLLDFGFCPKISDLGLFHLNDAIISLTSLRNLSLCFGHCSEVSDKGLSYFHGEFVSYPCLEILSLDFSYCSKISDQGLNSLKNGLIKLTSLQNLSLNFGHCSKVSEKGLGDLKDKLKSIPLLKVTR